MSFESTYESLSQHQVPAWYDDAKLGIFVHWGLYSVPGWAPPGKDIDRQVVENGWEAMFANNPYSEWYLNSLRVGDTPTRRHHLATYGANFDYDDFAPLFEQAAAQWNPDEWASLFQQVGARYVVLTTKHHDGYLLWPSQRISPHKPGHYAARRDLVGELTDAVRKRQMRMGLYYSGGLDWSFNKTPVRNFLDVSGTIVQSPEFIAYVDAHWHELIDRYQPSLLWNDIGYPAAANLLDLFAYYYNHVPDGVINDRWNQQQAERELNFSEMAEAPVTVHCDFTTPEYAAHQQIATKKWEGTRGIGHSFGYNQNEGPADYLTIEELVRSFVDIVSKNGNLLLDVGPMADGTIPEIQRERLLGLGNWLDVNGEAIFGSRPWIRAEGHTDEGEDIPVRFTQRDGALYACLLGTPSQSRIAISDRDLQPATSDGVTVQVLGHTAPLASAIQTGRLVVTLPSLPASPAHVLKIVPLSTR